MVLSVKLPLSLNTPARPTTHIATMQQAEATLMSRPKLTTRTSLIMRLPLPRRSSHRRRRRRKRDQVVGSACQIMGPSPRPAIVVCGEYRDSRAGVRRRRRRRRTGTHARQIYLRELPHRSLGTVTERRRVIVLRSTGFELFYPLTLRYSHSYCDSSPITTLDYTFFLSFVALIIVT